jgi:hypothetical protein
MSLKRTPVRPPIDYARDRARWVRLIHDTHAAVASDDPKQRAVVAAAGCSARSVWNPPARYPDGLLALSFAHLVYAWGRQSDPALRAATRDVLMQAAGLADQVIERATMTVGVDLSSKPDRVGEFAVRLPYRDN